MHRSRVCHFKNNAFLLKLGFSVIFADFMFLFDRCDQLVFVLYVDKFVIVGS
jgi:hypothetical protein